MKRAARPGEMRLIDAAIGKAAAYGFDLALLPTNFRTALTVEAMNAKFIKYHLGGGYALHRFKGVDVGPAHDHPCGFTTLILAPYVEDIYTLADGGWRVQRVRREAGSTHAVAASAIHQIVELPDGTSWTLVLYGRHVQETRFYRFGQGVESRTWRQRTWRAH